MPTYHKMTPEEFFGTMTDEQRKYILDQDRQRMAKIMDTQENKKPILVLDFDGVLHSYSSGWQGAGTIPDPPVEGAQEFCREALQKFNLWIVSSRCNQPGGVTAIQLWLEENGFPQGIIISQDGSKPAAFMAIDDRVHLFDGMWPDVDQLLQFKPWYKK